MKAQKVKLSLLFILVASVLGYGRATASDQISDAVITKWVKEALMEDPRVNTENVQIKTKDGVVTLSGTVNNLSEKKYADLESKKIRGVIGVVNELNLKMAYRADSDIRGDVMRRLTRSPMLNIKDLQVKVNNGIVNLSGQVASWIEQKEADDLASEVRGVKSLENNLVIQFKTERSDKEILKDIEASIDRDVYLNNLPIIISVKEGNVILEGSVGNVYERERAEFEALSIMNVKSVDDQLKIRPLEVYEVKYKSEQPDDNELKKNVSAELFQDPRIDPFEIQVDALDGMITLRGRVPYFYQRNIVEKDAREVIGVMDVKNLLRVETIQAAYDDSEIQHDVQNRIDFNDILTNDDIKVQVKDGVVILSGRVDTYWKIDYAKDIASRAKGVINVINNLTLNRLTKLTDEILEYKIKRRLESNWLTSLVANYINVEVHNGVVTLKGKVYTYSEYKEAARLASLTKGIWKIVNNLTID